MEKAPLAGSWIALIFLLAGGCANFGAPQPTVQVPDNLKPGPGEALAQIVSAKGAQIYECRARKDASGALEWAFVAPEAELFDSSGKRVGRHYAGPHWESDDGSKILGTVKQRADAPTPGAIPWLLLTAKSVGADGSFSKVTSIQRVATAGGVAPATGCSQAGTQARVPYTAEYYFFTVK